MFKANRSTWMQSGLIVLAGIALSACGSARYATPTEEQFSGFLSVNANADRYQSLVEYLGEKGVADVVPIRHLLRQGTDWEKVHRTPFAIPPGDLWPNIVNTLIVLRDDVIPLVGPVEVVSAFRTKEYNAVAGGASRSKHLEFSAVDLIPIQKISRAELHSRLKKMWEKKGKQRSVGLGLYSRLRFHIDTGGYRTW